MYSTKSHADSTKLIIICQYLHAVQPRTYFFLWVLLTQRTTFPPEGGVGCQVAEENHFLRGSPEDSKIDESEVN